MSRPTGQFAAALGRVAKGRRALVTGSTGFVGSWLAYVLADHGAEVVGMSLPVPADDWASRAPLAGAVRNLTVDVRDYEGVLDAVREVRPDLVFHLAAQPLVMVGYQEPVATFASNVMGTAHVLEALRKVGQASACVVVTSDKCYATSPRPHTETDPMGGDDPYSASKGAAELVAAAYISSYSDDLPPTATARAGNIIGGGDWAPGRIVPDWARSVRDGASLLLRRPGAARPWQHVLDAVAGYVLLADALLASGRAFQGGWNFGPPPGQTTTVAELVELLQRAWQDLTGRCPPALALAGEPGPEERMSLALDSTKASERLFWRQQLPLEETVGWTAEWYVAALLGSPAKAAELSARQVGRYLRLAEERMVGVSS